MKFAAPAAFLVAFAFAAPAIAQPVASADLARRIAMSQGMVTVEEIEQDDGIWAVEGRDIDGYDMDVDIDAATGRILAIKADEPSRTVGAATALRR